MSLEENFETYLKEKYAKKKEQNTETDAQTFELVSKIVLTFRIWRASIMKGHYAGHKSEQKKQYGPRTRLVRATYTLFL